MGGFLSHLTPEENSEVLNATCGPIRGNIYEHNDKIVDGYLGIPFAKPPIGNLRFKKPVEAEKWAETKDCFKYGPGCPQSGSFGATLPDEFGYFAENNCLNLSVFTPRWKSEEFPKGFPVIVYFHGGGFEVGTQEMLHDYSLAGTLIRKDVIVVTVNYRLGPLGFLTTGDEVSRGNYGLWDQTLALQWVQKHIGSFGGDNTNVTISGSSAGGASVDLLSLSPHSNHLFHRLYAMSGTAYCDFAIRTTADQVKVFKEFAKHHGYTGEDSESLLEWYQSQPVDKFKQVAEFTCPASGFLHFVPNHDGDFFPKPLDELRKEAPKFDVMTTVGEYEGLGMVVYHPLFKDPVNNFDTVISNTFGADVTEDFQQVQKKLFDFYANGLEKTNHSEFARKFVEFYGDSLINIGALETVKSHVSHGNNAYLGSFDYFNFESKSPSLALFPFKAASHSSDFKYIFGSGVMKSFTPNEEELKVMDMMSRIFTNFAKYGNPNGKKGSEQKWEKYSLSQPERYFKIDYPNSEMRDNFQNGRLEIFDEINRHVKKYQEIIYGKKL